MPHIYCQGRPNLNRKDGRGSGHLNVAGPFKARNRVLQTEAVAVSDGLKSSVADRDAYPRSSIFPALKGRAKITWPLPRPSNRPKAQIMCGIRRLAGFLQLNR
jgi:hypothetical protein